MSGEGDFIALMRELASDPAARGLMDDAAVLETGGSAIVLTHDMLVEGVHYRADDPPQDVAWKLVAVNISDLAAKGAQPTGVLMGFALNGATEWERAFAEGLADAIAHFGAPLLGGDTVAMPDGAPRAMGLTAIGRAPEGGAPSRAGAEPGDLLFVTGSIGDAGLGLAVLAGEERATGEVRTALVDAYRRPRPPLGFGRAVAPLVKAMADVSDGLLIDARRMAQASGCGVCIAAEAIPLSPASLAVRGDTTEARIAAATAGDDYQLLFGMAPEREGEVAAIARDHGVPIARCGRFTGGDGIVLEADGKPVPLPGRLGFEHRG